MNNFPLHVIIKINKKDRKQLVNETSRIQNNMSDARVL